MHELRRGRGTIAETHHSAPYNWGFSYTSVTCFFAVLKCGQLNIRDCKLADYYYSTDNLGGDTLHSTVQDLRWGLAIFFFFLICCTLDPFFLVLHATKTFIVIPLLLERFHEARFAVIHT